MTLVQGISSQKFPGIPATLEVMTILSELGKPEEPVGKIWRFYNAEPNPQSLINRVEIWECASNSSHPVIKTAFIYFKAFGCEEMQKAFANKIHAEFFHHYEGEWCQLKVDDPKEIYSFLSLINQTQQFAGNAKDEMQLILSKLKPLASRL